MQQTQTLLAIQKLVRTTLKELIHSKFPNIDQKHLENIPLNSVSNQLDIEYQSPLLMKLFNANKKDLLTLNIKSQIEFGNQLVENFNAGEVISKLEVNPQGFLNIRLTDKLIEQEINKILQFGVLFPKIPIQNIAVDFSSPNVAKEMHVGHLRSTILGESICRIFEFMGHTVHRINHIGDWGTQFGMLIAYLKFKYPDFLENFPKLKDLETFYKESKQKFDSDEEFKKESQLTVVKLQSLDPDCLKAWKVICEISSIEYNKIYKRLDVHLNEFGESFYNPMIPDMIKELEEKGLCKIDQGAKCVFIKGSQIPLMVQKSDGAFNYDSTDMTAIKYRIQTLNSNRLIYITDSGQLPHFQLIFEGAKLAGWVTPNISLEHMGFGVVQGNDGKRFKTRSGDTVKLMDLLDEAAFRALEQIKSRANETKEFGTGTFLSEEEYVAASEQMGCAAVKYYDLKQNRISNYQFNYDKMLDPKGNTAVYLLYSYARICSILRKGGLEQPEYQKIEFKLTNEYERYLGCSLIKFVDVIQSSCDQLAINWLCDYIYELATKISECYNKYKIVEEEHGRTRLSMIEAVRQVMLISFNMVGVKPLEKI